MPHLSSLFPASVVVPPTALILALGGSMACQGETDGSRTEHSMIGRDAGSNTGGSAGGSAQESGPGDEGAAVVAKPGWRDSTSLLCAHVGGLPRGRLSVSGDRILVLVTHDCNDLAGVTCEGTNTGEEVYENTGAGWRLAHGRTVLGKTPVPVGIADDGSGALLLWDSGDCQVDALAESGVTPSCLFPREPDRFIEAAGVGPNKFGLVTVSRPDGSREFLADSDGRLRAHLPPTPAALPSEKDGWPIGINAIALNGDEIIVAAAGGFLERINPTTGLASPLADAPKLDYTAVAVVDGDVIAGSASGQLVRYQAGAWSTVDLDHHVMVSAIQGVPGGDLVALTDQGLWRVRGVQAKLLGRAEDLAPGYLFLGLGITSRDEVVVMATATTAVRPDACSASIVWWFDGTEFHRF